MVNRFQKSFSFHPSQCLWGLCIALLISFVGRTPITPHQRPPESALVCTSHGDSQELRSSWDLFQPAWKAEPLPHYHLKDLMSDPQNRIEPVMKIPKAISKRVLFWSAVYSVYSIQSKLVHDRFDPSVIYGYIDLGRAADQWSLSQSKLHRIEKQTIDGIRQRIGEAYGLFPVSITQLRERMEIRQFFAQHGKSDAQIPEMLDSIRTQSGQKENFLAALRRSQDLLPRMESIFEAGGLPKGLTRIPFVESSFHPRAHSKVGAVGIWQFMPPTARQYIHATNRRLWTDPIRQTHAAARLLRDYNRMVGDWGLAITSYHSGVGRVRRLARTHGVDQAPQLIHAPGIRENLGFAGRNFFSEVLAANFVHSYKTELFAEVIKRTLASHHAPLSCTAKDQRPWQTPES